MLERIFRIGEYWSTATFFLLLFLGIAIALCCGYAAPCPGRLFRRRKVLTVDSKGFVYFLVFLILWGLYTFRDVSTGADTQTYVDLFLNASGFQFDFQRFLAFKQNEILYDLLTIAVRAFTDNYRIYFAIVGIFIGYAYVRFFRSYWEKGTSIVFLILFVLVYQYNFAALRSALGEMFLLISLCNMAEKKFRKALVLSIIGSLFHYTILINIFFVIFYKCVLKRNSLNKRRLYCITAMCVVIFLIAVPVVRTILLRTRYRTYAANQSFRIIGYWYVFVTLIIAFVAIKKKGYYNDKMSIAIAASFFSVILVFIAGSLGAYRLVGYYALVRYNLWDRSLDLFFKNKTIRGQYKVVAFCLVLLFFAYQMGRNSEVPGFAYRLGELI